MVKGEDDEKRKEKVEEPVGRVISFINHASDRLLGAS